MTKQLIKICGIRDAKTAREAAIAGADFIGIVFHHLSPRFVGLEQAKAIATAVTIGGALPVAVFMDHNAATMCSICAATGIRIIQLHGMARAYHQHMPAEYQKIYVLTVAKHGELKLDEGLIDLDPMRDYILIDNNQPGLGKPIINRPKFHYDLPFSWFLAGGLSSANVGAAIAAWQPNGVDVSSGVELSRGNKDLSLIQQFINSVRRSKHAI